MQPGPPQHRHRDSSNGWGVCDDVCSADALASGSPTFSPPGRLPPATSSTTHDSTGSTWSGRSRHHRRRTAEVTHAVEDWSSQAMRVFVTTLGAEYERDYPADFGVTTADWWEALSDTSGQWQESLWYDGALHAVPRPGSGTPHRGWIDPHLDLDDGRAGNAVRRAPTGQPRGTRHRSSIGASVSASTRLCPEIPVGRRPVTSSNGRRDVDERRRSRGRRGPGPSPSGTRPEGPGVPARTGTESGRSRRASGLEAAWAGGPVEDEVGERAAERQRVGAPSVRRTRRRSGRSGIDAGRAPVPRSRRTSGRSRRLDEPGGLPAAEVHRGPGRRRRRATRTPASPASGRRTRPPASNRGSVADGLTARARRSAGALVAIGACRLRQPCPEPAERGPRPHVLFGRGHHEPRGDRSPRPRRRVRIG